MSCPPPSFSCYACIMHATATKRKRGAERATPRRRQTRPTKRTKKEEPQNQKETQKGLGANPGLETSQNSQGAMPMRRPLKFGTRIASIDLCTTRLGLITSARQGGFIRHHGAE